MVRQDQSEEEKLARAQRQLLVIGVSCVAIIIFTLWLVTLRTTFARNRRFYPTVLTTLRLPYDDFKRGVQELKVEFTRPTPYAK